MAQLVTPHVQHDVPRPHADLRQQRVQELLETFLRRTRNLLQEGSDRNRTRKTARAFLDQRGIQPDDFQRLPLGLLLDTEEMAQALCEAGFRPEEVEASKLTADPRLAGRLIGPIHDGQGQILSFWARHPEDRSPKYLYKGRWQEAAGAFGLSGASSALKANGGNLLLVGDVLDAVLLVHQGFAPVAAIGGAPHEMTSVRWQRLAEQGVREATLMMCGGQANSRELVTALEAVFSATQSPRVFVVVSDPLRQTEWVSDLYRDHGAAAFRKLVECRIHAYHCKALALLDEYRPEGPWTDAARFAALAAARAFYESQAGQDRIDDLNRFFVPPILDELGLDWHGTPTAEEPDWEDVPEDENPDEAEPVDIAPAPASAAEKPFREAAERVEQPPTIDEGPRLEEPDECPQVDVRSVAEHLPEHHAYLAAFGGRRGLFQRTIPALDHFGGGLRGSIVVSGPAGAAKMALALQLGTDLVRTNPESCLLLVSASLTRQEAITRLKARLSGLNGKKLLQACCSHDRALRVSERERLEKAKREMADWGSRIFTFEQADCSDWRPERLRRVWDDLKARTGCRRGAVVIEGFEEWTRRRPSSQDALIAAFRDALSEDVLIAVSRLGRATVDAHAIFPYRQFPGWRVSRLSDPAETELLLRRWTAAELARHIGRGCSAEPILPERERRWRAVLARRGWIPHKLEVRDPRQPGLAGEIELTFLYRTWDFREGTVNCRGLFLSDWESAGCLPSTMVQATNSQALSAMEIPSSQPPEQAEQPLVAFDAVEPRRLRGRGFDDCTMHQCGTLDCFCFD